MGETSSTICKNIVPEALTEKNHEYWFSCVRRYLKAQELWDVVDGTFAKPSNQDDEEWTKQNDEAFRVILISCGSDFFSKISEISEAKVAWNTLKHIYKKEPRPGTSRVREGGFIDLRKHIYDNNWDEAKKVLEAHPGAWTTALDSSGQTALHVAAQCWSGHNSILNKLVEMEQLKNEYLEILDDFGHTPLSMAVDSGVIDINLVDCMVRKNKILPTIAINKGSLPVTLALANGYTKLGRYLYEKTPKEILKPEKGNIKGLRLLRICFISLHLDIALDLLKEHKELLFTKDHKGIAAIERIAVLPSVLLRGSPPVFDWKRWIYKYINIESGRNIKSLPTDIERPTDNSRHKGMEELKLKHACAREMLDLVCNNVSTSLLSRDEMKIAGMALYRATREGNVEFVVRVSKAYPKLILQADSKWWNTFFHAVAWREPEVFSLIQGCYMKDRLVSWRDISGNTLLHVAAELDRPAKFKLNSISGPALHMQRELQWFKEVESVVPPWVIEHQNNDGLKPHELFKETHKELRKEGEKWMKGAASSGSVVGALVVTIMFTAVFTVPGGFDPNSGLPILLDKQKKFFKIFIISDAISLFSSTTSVLMFLGILTSRYAEQDFLKYLPTKFILGLTTLFLSIATMVIAFSATILMMWLKTPNLLDYQGYLLVIILASVPVIVFCLLQLPLLVKMFLSTYGPSIFNRKVKTWL